MDAGSGFDDTLEGRSRAIFLRVEHAAYLALGALLVATAVLGLASAVGLLWGVVRDWADVGEGIISIIDRLLFVLMLVEILHTVRVSLRSGELAAEPFLIVGLIASIRRVLVITLESSEAHQQAPSAKSEALFRASMIELGVLSGLILVMVFSIWLLRRRQADGARPLP